MDLLEKLGHYIASQLYPEHNSREQEAIRYPFLTISREAGAGGHLLANALLDEMARNNDSLFDGWKVFDASFCARILEDVKLMASLESLQKEETPSLWEETVYDLVGSRASPQKVFWKTFKAMKLLAEIGKVIIIGRGGVCATKALPGGIHLRLVAPLSMRIERMKERLHISETNARRIVEDYDVERAKFVRAHFGEDIRDPLLYHAVYNTGQLSFEEIAKDVVEMIKSRAPKSATVLDFSRR